MPTLLELQHAMRSCLLEGDAATVTAMLGDGISSDRLDIYRNTLMAGATRALRLNFPAVHRLVGDEFFQGAAAIFVAECPPATACLDHYGGEFAEFLEQFGPARSLGYLADVARLEWAVSRALHADDAKPLDLVRLADLSPDAQARVAFVPHPAFSLLCSAQPMDAIWRAVLDRDDTALGRIDLAAGPVHLLVERRTTSVEVTRLDEAAWRFADALRQGMRIAEAVAGVADDRAYVLLSEHLTAGRFVDFRVMPEEVPVLEDLSVPGDLPAPGMPGRTHAVTP